MADDQKINLRCVLISSKEGVPIRQLMRDYRQLVSADLDLQGYPNLTAYLRSIPEIVRLSNENGEVVCHGVASERSSHIEALISKQRSKKKKRPSARGGRGGRGNSLLGSGSSASLRGRSSMSSASSFSSLSSASAFSAGASAYRGRPSADRGAIRGQRPSYPARGRGTARGGGRRPLQEQQIYLPPSMRTANSAGSNGGGDGRGGSRGSGGDGFNSRGAGGGSDRKSFGFAANPRAAQSSLLSSSSMQAEQRPQVQSRLAPSPPRSRQPSEAFREPLSQRTQNLTISSVQPKQPAPDPADYADLLAAARSIIQPRGTERSYFWRQAAEQSGAALPAQCDTLEASLVAEGALRVEDVLGRMMYYPGDPVGLDDSILIRRLRPLKRLQ
ncbi:hypothetical protein BOX15_Mlig016662g2 [Macrostomum lignano]|uniref:HTH OST-type domain-containing protein n=1 Tax=Macrostomum lignano TaxID=282301 RepID=A0A267G993_9PLAT|nr:hypothetical protein BOX15_Mlig016662g2 [Macrostomum lignano]